MSDDSKRTFDLVGLKKALDATKARAYVRIGVDGVPTIETGKVLTATEVQSVTAKFASDGKGLSLVHTRRVLDTTILVVVVTFKDGKPFECSTVKAGTTTAIYKHIETTQNKARKAPKPPKQMTLTDKSKMVKTAKAMDADTRKALIDALLKASE
jgi:hypothetical protein